MDRQALITRFEAELGKVNRPGIDKLMGYIRGSDFYTAPASTKFHLSCEGGLLQHSLNVLDALRGLLYRNGDGPLGVRCRRESGGGNSHRERDPCRPAPRYL